MAKFHGVGVNWGVDSTIIGVNGAFQTREHSYRSSSEQIRDAGNTTVSKAYWDPVESAVFTYVAVQAFTDPYGAAHVDIPTQADWVTVVDPKYPAIAGDWLVDDIIVESGNTKAARVTLHLSRYPNLYRV